MVAFKRRLISRSDEPEEKQNGQFIKYWPLMILRVGDGGNPAMARIRAFFVDRGFAVEVQDARLPSELQYSSYKLIFLVGPSREEVREKVTLHHPELAKHNRVLFADNELEDFISEYASVKSRSATITKLIEHKQEMGTFDEDVLYSSRNNWLRKQVEAGRRLGFMSWRDLKELASGECEEEDTRRLLLAQWVPVFSLVGMLVWTAAWIVATGEISAQAIGLAAVFFAFINSLRPSVGEEE